MSWWFVAYWLVWGLVGFGLVEYIAIKRKAKGDTLSETVWWLERVLRIGGSGKGIPLFKWFLAGGMVWLFLHFILRGLDVWMWK